MKQKINFITLGVRDLKRMRKFYEEKFAWKILTSNDDIVFFKLNGCFLGLFGREALAKDAGVNSDGHGFSGVTLSQNLSSEKEVDDLFVEFAAKEIKIIKKPEKVFWGGYHGYVEDPEHNLWEIAYNPFLTMDAEGNAVDHESLGG
jgi:hypothetical protein